MVFFFFQLLLCAGALYVGYGVGKTESSFNHNRRVFRWKLIAKIRRAMCYQYFSVFKCFGLDKIELFPWTTYPGGKTILAEEEFEKLLKDKNYVKRIKEIVLKIDKELKKNSLKK